MVTVRAVLPSKLSPSLLLALDSAKMITMATMMASTATPPITPPVIAPMLAPAESTMAAQKSSIVSINPLYVKVYTTV